VGGGGLFFSPPGEAKEDFYPLPFLQAGRLDFGRSRLFARDISLSPSYEELFPLFSDEVMIPPSFFVVSGPNFYRTALAASFFFVKGPLVPPFSFLSGRIEGYLLS